jgi:hypothetical protein
LEDLGIHRRRRRRRRIIIIIIHRILFKYDGKAFTSFIWLRIGTI